MSQRTRPRANEQQSVAVRLQAVRRKREMKRQWLRDVSNFNRQIGRLDRDISSSLSRCTSLRTLPAIQSYNRRQQQQRASYDSQRQSRQAALQTTRNQLDRLKRKIDLAVSRKRQDQLSDIETLYGAIEKRVIDGREAETRRIEELSVQTSAVENELRVLWGVIRGREQRRKLKVSRLHQQRQRVKRSRASRSRRAISARTRPSSTASAASTSTSDLPPEVLRFDEFLRRHHGETGDWDDQSHAFFMRVRSRYRNQCSEDFVSEMLRRVPSLTPSRIENHIRFVEEFERLRNEKKNAIVRWKESRAASRQQIEESVGTGDAILREAEVREKKRALASQRRLQVKKRRVEEWKRKREAEERAKAEREARDQRSKARATRQRIRKRQEEIQSQVQEFRDDRRRQQAESIRKKTSQQFRNRKRVSSSDLEALRQRDAKALSKRQALIATQRKKASAAQDRMNRHLSRLRFASTPVERDPDRLTRKTSAQLAREKQIQERNKKRGSVDSQFILSAPIRRIVPTWRAGV